MEQLKKCPFCGGEAYLESSKVRKGYEAVVQCTCCIIAMETITYDEENEAVQKAITAWNTRKPMGLIVERLEALRAEHEEREKDARLVGLTKHADLNGIKAYIYDDAIEIVKEEGLA